MNSQNWIKLGRGTLIALLAAALSTLLMYLNDNQLPSSNEWSLIAITGLSTGLGYFLKNGLLQWKKTLDEKLQSSPYGKLSISDIIKGAIVTFFAVAIQGLIDLLQTGFWPSIDQLKSLAITAVAALLSYLIKNVFTNSLNEFGKEP